MDISIIISGNLTGFSRFYASPNANDIYNEAKFDFDYRNFLTFINAGEKAYAISFSPKVIAVSLITRILDSFRRPGILVVTALVPRYQLVSGTLNAQDKSAIYRLLNEINDKFYEKNFLNGMVNQNPAVLMQDYYSDILRNYVLVGDRMQKAINTTIEVNSPNKRIGYVSTSEKDMPKYLSSLMRKSYNGYHHVFFADKAPTNIDEPADEIVTYRVRIENGNRNVPGEVRLTDKIPTVTPEQGERPLSNTNFTYGQVLNGEAGPDIIGTIENDTIVMSFRFPKEEKTVYFKFFDGANELLIPLIRPILVESNGTSLNLSSDSFTFYGKEIYGRKTIKSGNPEYTIDPTTSMLDLQRCNNGSTVNIYVRRGWELIFNFRNANYPKTIILTNRYTHEQERFDNVRDSINRLIPGNKSEWDMEILSDYYETVKIPATTTQFNLNRKKQNPPIQDRGNSGHGTNVQRGGSGTKTQGNSGQQIRLSGGGNDSAKEQARIEAEKKKRLIQYCIYAVVAIICCIGGWCGYTIWKGDKGGDEIQPNESWVTKNVIFSLEDGSVNQPTIEDDNLALLDFTIASNSAKIEDGENQYSKTITYNPENSNDTIIVRVTFNKIDEAEPLIFAFNRYTIDELNEGINSIVLSVKNSELTSYRELKNEKIPENWESQLKRMANDSDKNVRAYAIHLVSLKNEIDAKAKADAEAKAKADADAKAKAKAEAEAKAKKEAESKTQTKAPKFEISWTLSDVRSKKGKEEYKGYDKQLTAIDKCLTSLKAGKVNIPDNLPSNFVQILNNLKALDSRINAISDTETQKELKQIFKEEIQKKSESVNKEQDNLVGTCKLQNKIRNAERKQNNQ